VPSACYGGQTVRQSEAHPESQDKPESRTENRMASSRTVLTMALCAAAALAQSQEYVIETYAGGAPPPTPAHGVNLSLSGRFTLGVATDAAGNVYFNGFHCVFRMGPDGIVTLIAGTSRPGFAGDGGPATAARLNLAEKYSIGVDGEATLPAQLTVDGEGNVYIADSGNNRIRKISPDGIITTVAGNGTSGFSGDGGSALDAQLSDVGGLAVDLAGNLFLSDPANHRIRRISPGGIITTWAGTGQPGLSGDGRPAAAAQLHEPLGLATDTAGNLFVADHWNGRIRRISPDGTIATVADKDVGLKAPTSVAVDPADNLLIADTAIDEFDGDFVQVVVKVSAGGSVTTVAGNGAKCVWDNADTLYCPVTLGDGGPATQTYLFAAHSLATDTEGNLLLADSANGRIRKVSADGNITTIAGGAGSHLAGDDGPATIANLSFPRAVAVDSSGDVFISDSSHQRIRKVSRHGTITTVAGNGVLGFAGDGGQAADAELAFPAGIAVDLADNLFIADEANVRIRKVATEGTISTLGDCPWKPAYPFWVAVDRFGDTFVIDVSSHITRASPSGVTTAVAKGYVAAVDDAGNLYFVSNGQIFKLTPDGRTGLVAGNGSSGYSGDGTLATEAQIRPIALAVDSAGNIFVADASYRIRRISPDGVITTIAGNGMPGYSGDGGPATRASISTPFGLAVDEAGNLYFADSDNNAVRVLRPATSQHGVRE